MTMKITAASILALLSSASAFAPNANTSPASTLLQSTPTYMQDAGAIGAPAFRTDALATRTSEEIWEALNSIPVQGSSLRTCSFETAVERVEVYMRTEGRPLNADVQLWQGPDNTPQKMQVYLEDGSMRPFRAVVETPGDSNANSIRNTGELE